MTTSTRIALAAATAAAGFWTAKSIAIATAGGLGKSPFEGPLFFAGLLSCLNAAAALGVALTRGRSRATRIAAGIVGPILGAVLASAIDAVVGFFHAPGEERYWIWSEFNLWVTGTLVLVLAITVAMRSHIGRATFRHRQAITG